MGPNSLACWTKSSTTGSVVSGRMVSRLSPLGVSMVLIWIDCSGCGGTSVHYHSRISVVAGTIGGVNYGAFSDNLLNSRETVGSTGLESAINELRVSSTSRLTWIRVCLLGASFCKRV